MGPIIWLFIGGMKILHYDSGTNDLTQYHKLTQLSRNDII